MAAGGAACCNRDGLALPCLAVSAGIDADAFLDLRTDYVLEMP